MEDGRRILRILLNILIPAMKILLVCVGGLWLLKFFLPFVIGWLIAMVANPLVKFLERRLNLVRKHSSVIIVVAVLAGIIGGLYFLVGRVIIEIRLLVVDMPEIYEAVRLELMEALDSLNRMVARMPTGVQEWFNRTNENLGGIASSLMQKIAFPTVTVAGNVAKGIPGALVNSIVVILSSYFFIAEQDRIREDILRFLQKKDQARKLDKRTLVVLAQLIVSTFYSFETCSAEKMLTNPQILDCLDQSTNSAAGLLAFLDKVTAQYKERVLLNEKDGNAALLGQIKSYVGSHLENPLNREEIAEKFFISKDYLSHLFARQEGMGFTQYVNEQRISKAKELLQNSDLPIKIIALNVGISDYAYFSKMFRKSAGISANELPHERRAAGTAAFPDRHL